MSEFTTLSSKGQLVIPKRVREQAGLNAGDQLEILWTGDRLELRKAEPVPEQPQTSVVRELLGKYRTAQDEEEHADDNAREMRKSLHGKIDP